MGFENNFQIEQLPQEPGIEEKSKIEADDSSSKLKKWYSYMVLEQGEKLKEHGISCDIVPLPEGVYSHALIIKKEQTEQTPKVRVARTIFTTQNNLISDIFNQCGYASRVGSQSHLTASAENNIDKEEQLETLIDQFLEEPSLLTLTKICDVKQQRSANESEKEVLEKELIMVENEILEGGNIIDAVEGLIYLHPFSVSESGLSPSVSVSFADPDKKPFKPAVSGIEIENERIIGLTLVVDVTPERLDFSDVWQGAIRKRIMPEEISAILISGLDSSEKKDNFQIANDKIPGNVLSLSERDQILTEIHAKRIAKLDIKRDRLQILKNKQSRER